MNYLYLFQIGPVQAFIAQARRTQDLYVGSRMLSVLAGAGVMAARDLADFQPIFPFIENNRLPKGVPHRFAFISSSEPSMAATQVRDAIQNEWQNRFVMPVYNWLKGKVGAGAWEAVYQEQTADWLDFHWVAVPYQPKQHAQSFSKAGQALASRRLSREIKQSNEAGIKCTLTGSQSALPLDWKLFQSRLNDPQNIVLRDNERLGSLAVIKRFAGENFANCGLDVDKFPSLDSIAGSLDAEETYGKDTTNYVAVLHMDGDRMGEKLSQFTSLAEHQNFSKSLSQFADSEVDKILQDYDRAQVIYSGGDDVLALLPISSALAAAKALRDAFLGLTGCTASAGIAFTPTNLPLDLALEISRDTEKAAKNEHGRDAVVIKEAHGTGQTRPAGATWNSNITDFVAGIQNEFAQKTVSGRIGYDLQSLAHDLAPSKAQSQQQDFARSGFAEMLQKARQAELRRLLERRVSESVQSSEKQRIVQQQSAALLALGEDENTGWEALANWVIIARFLAQGAAIHD